MTTRPIENRCCHPYISRLLFSLCSKDLRERCLNYLSALLILSQQVLTADTKLQHHHSEWPEGIQSSPRFTIRAGLKTSSSSLRILPRCRTGGKITLYHSRRWWMGGKYLLHISRYLLSFIHVHYPSSGNIYQPNNESPRGARKAIC